jgi:hypothetical protein
VSYGLNSNIVCALPLMESGSTADESRRSDAEPVCAASYFNFQASRQICSRSRMDRNRAPQDFIRSMRPRGDDRRYKYKLCRADRKSLALELAALSPLPGRGRLEVASRAVLPDGTYVPLSPPKDGNAAASIAQNRSPYHVARALLCTRWMVSCMPSDYDLTYEPCQYAQ